MSLSERQSQILEGIIEEYIESAHPVASVDLVQKKQLTVSGATVRNIMSDLVRKGYLKMHHVSSGRVPTELAYRYYITKLMDESDVEVINEIAIKQKVWDDRYEIERLLKSMSCILSEVTNSLVISITEDGFITSSGFSRILDWNEFWEIDVAKSTFRLADDYDLVKSVYGKCPETEGVSVLIGRETGLAHMELVSIVFCNRKVGNTSCYVGVLGPSRTQYMKVIPVVRYVSKLLDEINDTV